MICIGPIRLAVTYQQRAATRSICVKSHQCTFKTERLVGVVTDGRIIKK